MRTYFDDAIGAVPPSPIDVDAVIARRRRRDRYRRIGFAGTTAIAVAAGIALAAGGTGGAPDPVPAGATTPEPVDRLTDRVRAAVAREAPGLRWVEPYEAVEQPVKSKTARARNDWAVLGDAAGTGSLFVSLGEPGTPSPDPSSLDFVLVCRPDEGERCATSVGANGERILRRQSTFDGGLRANYVSIGRRDGALIWLSAANFVFQRGLIPTRPASRAEPVLTLDQLQAVGLSL